MKMKCELTPVKLISGIGPARAALLEKMGIFTCSDLLYHFPRGYQNRGDISSVATAQDGIACAFLLTIADTPRTTVIKNRITVTKFTAFDESGKCTVIFFNQRYTESTFTIGTTFRFYGKMSVKYGRRELSSPVYELYNPNFPLQDYVPIYPLTSGISQKQMASFVKGAVKILISNPLNDPIPPEVRKKHGIPEINDALVMVHSPESIDDINNAQRRFIFEEFYIYSIGMAISRKTFDSFLPIAMKQTDTSEFTDNLPYILTNAQKRVINEIQKDMCDAKTPMHRILTGDVGSGKTVCAAAAAFTAIRNGYQTALMVPTEILAEQHYRDMSDLFDPLGISVALLTGSITGKKRTEILKLMESGDTSLIVGTHALISEKVIYKNLGLVITDEQHRFGVTQRTALIEKSKNENNPCHNIMPHVLVMSATPIPRTLSLTVYGDLALSTLDELPPGRKPVDTFLVDDSYRERLHKFMRKQLNENHQIYVVCPAVESQHEDDESELSDNDLIFFDDCLTFGAEPRCTIATKTLSNVRSTVKMLSEEIFPDIPVGFVHGKMKPTDKEKVMSDFVCGKIKILVSTTVIEVGVNVPNATLMIIEDADRFGLAQLHQLRGRVGRGADKSYCVLVSNNKSANAIERLKEIKNTSDGFKIAQKDLVLRGPGDFFPDSSGNTKQHGTMGLRLSLSCNDSQLLNAAASDAASTVSKDPNLENEENAVASEIVKKIFSRSINTFH